MNKFLLFIFYSFILIVFTFIYENKNERLLHKFIDYALKNEDVVFETDLKDAKYVCGFMSVYSSHLIKPNLKRIGANYTPMIAFTIHTNRKGEGSSAIVAVKEDNSLFITYLSGYNIEFTKPVDWNSSRCMKTKNLHYKIKNKNLYVTP